MKIAVYTIALNEEKHVARWHASAKEADLLLIADTGSTDKTRFLAKSLGIKVHQISVVPWRFDVARNASLALIPEDFDICIQLDMDEVLQDGWREILENAFSSGINWPSYREVTSRDANGQAISWFNHHRIHPRKGFIWRYPIHEVIEPTQGTPFKREFIELEIDHIQDHTKSRKSYLNLLEMAVKEDPRDWRMRHYLNREYWYNKDWNKVLSSAYEAMEIAEGWDVERASTCMWASEAAHFLNLKKLSIEWAERATSEAPNFYEAWHWRAHIAHLCGDWESCREFSFKRLTLERQNHHLVKPEVWEWWGYDLMALSSHKLLDHQTAVKYGKLALNFAILNERLNRNLEFYLEALRPTSSESSKNLNTNKPIAFLKNGSVKVLDAFYVPFTRYDYMSEAMINEGLWDLDLTNWLISNVQPGWKCINVGSNSGYFLEVLSRLSGQNGKVIGFEPNKDLVHRYLKSQKQNTYLNCAPVEVHEVAIGNSSGEVNLWVPNGNLGGANLSGDPEKSLTGLSYPTNSGVNVTAPIKQLRNFDLGSADLILIDTEGSEQGVFESFSEELAATPLIIIETGSYHSDGFLEFLFDRYIVTDLSANRIEVAQIKGMPLGGNINVILQKKSLW